MQDRRFIVIEGPLGSGKTSLTKILAGRLNAKLVLEVDNPFLPSFFQDMEKHAFQTQIFSLLSRYNQQKEILQVDLFQQQVMSDYLFVGEHIFAQLHLSQDEFMLYDKLLRTLDMQAPVPDLVIYLQSQPEVLYERLQKSVYPYSRDVPPDYIEAMSEAFNNYFFSYNLSPLLVINTSKADFFSDDRHVDELTREMERVRSGVHHFVPT